MTDVTTVEVLDSRTDFGCHPDARHTTTARAGVPSGGSTGSHEAAEGLTALERHGG